jgi:hypothetical protein
MNENEEMVESLTVYSLMFVYFLFPTGYIFGVFLFLAYALCVSGYVYIRTPLRES